MFFFVKLLILAIIICGEDVIDINKYIVLNFDLAYIFDKRIL